MSGNERNRLFLNDGSGTFQDVSDISGADALEDGRAVVAADFDGDGDNDLFVHNSQLERHLYFENKTAPVGRPLKVRLRATSSQYEAIGSEVTLVDGKNRVTQIMARGNGFLTCTPPELIFGVTTRGPATLDVRWPDGRRERFTTKRDVASVQFVEGEGESIPR